MWHNDGVCNMIFWCIICVEVGISWVFFRFGYLQDVPFFLNGVYGVGVSDLSDMGFVVVTFVWIYDMDNMVGMGGR